jgi:hypothetical protein
MAQDEKGHILKCHHCGNTSLQTVLLTQPYLETFYAVDDGTDDQFPFTYTVVRCETCRQLLVYSLNDSVGPERGETPLGDLCYPRRTSLPDAVPERIRLIYAEAARVRDISPLAFVILARRLLEEVARDRDAASDDLAGSLSLLADRGDIPPVLAEATTLIRLVGNAGAHASDTRITAPRAWAVDDLLKAVIEYMYVAPAKIASFKKTLTAAV